MTVVLVVVAHPDDEVLGLGATIALHTAQDDDVYVCTLSEGASAQYPDPDMIRVRREASEVAARILGVKGTVYHGLPDSRMEAVPHIEINAIIEQHIQDIKPEIVFTHFSGDTDLDHQRAYQSTIVATRPKLGSPIKRVLCYEVLGQTHWNGIGVDTAFVPNVYVDVSEFLHKKIEAMKSYTSEIGLYPHPRSLEAIDALARFRGILCGTIAAEGFLLIREVQRAEAQRSRGSVR